MRFFNSSDEHYLDTPKNPFRDALTQICGRKAPPYVRGYSCQDMTEAEYEQLQLWVNNAGLPKAISWTTGIGLIEAAEHIVKEAVSNGNIPEAPWTLHRAARAVLRGYQQQVKEKFKIDSYIPRTPRITLEQIYDTLKKDSVGRSVPTEALCLRLSRKRVSTVIERSFESTRALLK